jgi:hypothetical protein
MSKPTLNSPLTILSASLSQRASKFKGLHIQRFKMTIPRTIACAPSRLEKNLSEPPIRVLSDSRTQNIFRPAAPQQQNKANWYLPIYRNTSLLSSPSSQRDATRTSRSFSSSFETTSITDENKKAYDLPDAFVPPRHTFRSSSSDGYLRANSKQLRPSDIVCGRGAPTNFHHGNHMFRDLVKNYETSYMCAKRSDKPSIAMTLLDIVHARGGRFVRKDKVAGRSAWVEIGEHRAYEKVCQALREEAPELRRQMLTVSLKSKANYSYREDERSRRG